MTISRTEKASGGTGKVASGTTHTLPTAPDRDCPLCPRLVAFRNAQRAREPSWFNAPVPSFGDAGARLLIVGLAPGLQGANRTGRPFTGDYAGDLLYSTLLHYGFAKGQFLARPDVGLLLVVCRICFVVRCVPPQNKPLPTELKNCRRFLTAEIAGMPGLRAIVALGRIAHDAVLAAQGLKPSAYNFGHGAMHELPDRKLLADSYHCSRYNTNTGVLTTEMFHQVFAKVKADLDQIS